MSIPFDELKQSQRVKWRSHACTVTFIDETDVMLTVDEVDNLILKKSQVNGAEPLVELLVCEDKTKENEVYNAAKGHFDWHDSIQVDFEHDRWWVTRIGTGAQWSVVDTSEGIDFELVTEGEE